jgi:hypothetical protein
MAGKVEIQGLDQLKRALTSLPQNMQAPILRDISRTPAAKAASIARKLFPYGNSGKTARTIGTLKVKNAKQTFMEVGFRGRSLGYIYISKNVISRKKRGSVKGTPWLFHRSGDMITAEGTRQMRMDLGKVMARHFKKFGYAPRMSL